MTSRANRQAQLSGNEQVTLRVLVLGNGGREHAIAWKLSQSPILTDLIVAPGNAGTAQFCTNVDVDIKDIKGILALAQNLKVEFTVVGPEAPLANGIVDTFNKAGLLIFGPSKQAALIETSKTFSKQLMTEHNIPTSNAQCFSNYTTALNYLNSHSLPVVIKADGIAGGKGVVVAESLKDARKALHDQMVKGTLGEAGKKVLVEDFMEGYELSVFSFVDGERVSPLVAACDYKRIHDGDSGPNTGGMGAYSPPVPDIWNSTIEYEARTRIIEPVIKTLNNIGSPYKGVLYTGLMKTREGLKVVEFNCRMGDPEAEVILLRLKSDLLEIMLATALGDISGLTFDWSNKASVGVVMASGGYPGSYKTGYPIYGIETVGPECTVFHAGTKSDGRVVTTDGGRVLTISATADNLEGAREKVYRNVHKVNFINSQCRLDIANIP